MRLTLQLFRIKIYLIGGRGPDRPGEGGEVNLDIVDIYDVKTNTWSEGPKLPERCHGASAAVLEGKIHVLWQHKHHWVLEDEKWKVLSDSPSFHLFCRMEVVNDKLYSIGITRAEGHEISCLHVYDARNDKWIPRAPLPKGLFLYRSTSAAVGDLIFTLRGSSGGSKARVDVYDTDKDVWLTDHQTPNPKRKR